MTDAKMVFEAAMAIMDNLSQIEGLADYGENREYKQRTLPILNTLLGELYPYSDNFPKYGKIRPICRQITDFQQLIELDDYICRSVLPYGLAAALLISEDQEAAAYCERRFNELKSSLKLGNPGEFEEIQDVYGGIGFLEFGRW